MIRVGGVTLQVGLMGGSTTDPPSCGVTNGSLGVKRERDSLPFRDGLIICELRIGIRDASLLH